jgi:hypothetical protein
MCISFQLDFLNIFSENLQFQLKNYLFLFCLRIFTCFRHILSYFNFLCDKVENSEKRPTTFFPRLQRHLVISLYLYQNFRRTVIFSYRESEMTSGRCNRGKKVVGRL